MIEARDRVVIEGRDMRGCTPRGQESGRFVVTGRGGLPFSPDEALRDRSIVSPGWVTLNSDVDGGRAGLLTLTVASLNN